VLGFVGTDGVGLTGLELGFQDVLAGTPGERTHELGLSGQAIVGGVDVEHPPVAGSSVVTTLDRDLQFQVQEALEDAVKTQHARGGTVIVMDPRTSQVLSMASYPWFDPNAFEDSPSATYRNRAVTDAFEPGSTNKVITAAAAIEEHAIPLGLSIDVPWTMPVGDYLIHDSHPHGVMRMTLGDIVAESSNIGAVKVADRLGAPALATYLSRFGLGHATGIGFPGESNGIMLPLDQWSDTSLATMAYGQGIAATPLQMASVYATIAERRPVGSALAGARDARRAGDFVAARPAQSHRVVSAATAHMVTRMLSYAVEYGTGINAQIPDTRSPARPAPPGSPRRTARATSRASTSPRSSAISRPAIPRSSWPRSWTGPRPATAAWPPRRCSAASRSRPSPGSASPRPSVCRFPPRPAGRMSVRTLGGAAGRR
jgi:cell division protein FtsI (penicillin-binding protein 3)